MFSFARYDPEFAKWMEGKSLEELLERLIQEVSKDNLTLSTHLSLTIQGIVPDPENIIHLRSKLQEAIICGKNNNTMVALNQYQIYLPKVTKILGKDNSEVVNAHLERGHLLQRQGASLKDSYWKQANSSLTRAIKSIENTSGPNDYRLLKAYYSLFCIKRQRDLSSEAEDCLAKALKVCKICCGMDDPEYAWLLLLESGYLIESEPLRFSYIESRIQQAINIYTSCFGKDIALSYCLWHLYKLHKKTGNTNLAEKTSSQLDEIRIKIGAESLEREPTLPEQIQQWRTKNRNSFIHTQ